MKQVIGNVLAGNRRPPEGGLSRTGFTLVELIMTIAVLGIVAIPISLMLSAHMESLYQSQDLTQAVNLARYDMETVNNMAYAGISSAALSSYQGYPYDINRSVVYVYGNQAAPESTKKVTVAVTRAGKSDILFQLTSYVTNNIRYPF